ncbi:hypothetical protein D7Y13_27125 [Corallococcus praedator]|uniref:Uncharacterized protein n=1 Tax=Corallococcus praedator TaxID=2316724 RepID=A0ABX9QC50_9BACT|nr:MULTISPECIES: hypothetical protein [Corallococcus]RKH17507.1 hypothetical protein D7X74_12180 [Corallococcus sp. CA047B]RKH31754.1 hypothetical protein D7X75_18360 [Corallococcus sp. CA031C]RKH99916.1 hypothetical protein D7Y13_27125 [Corallococcus praedator]
MATAMGGDVVMQMLRELREMQEEARIQDARTDAVIDAVIRQTELILEHSRMHFERTRVLFARSRELSAQTRVLFEQTRVLFDRTDELSRHIGVLSESTDTFRESLEKLADQMQTLARELKGVKSTHGRMLEQVARSLHRLAEAQDSDRQRIHVLELNLDGTGKP